MRSITASLLRRILPPLFCALFFFAGYLEAAIDVELTPPSYKIGVATAASTHQYLQFVNNNGNEMLKFYIYNVGSANWSPSGSPGFNQYLLEVSDTHNSNYTIAYQFQYTSRPGWANIARLSPALMYIRFTMPIMSNTSSTQTVNMFVTAETDDTWTYNVSGGFYWRNVGDSGAPGTSWATSSSTIMTSSKWQYMTNPSIGWLTFGTANTFSQTTSQSFVVDHIRTNGYGNTITGTCYYSHSSLRTYNFTSGPSDAMRTLRVSFAKYTVGTLINSALATNTYATRSILMPSLDITSEYQALRRSYSVTYCSLCGYVPARNTSNGGVNQDMSARTINIGNFSIDTPRARIIVLN